MPRSGSTSPSVLVDTLLHKPDLSASLLQFLEEDNMQPNVVRDLVKHHPNIFNMKGEIIKLSPQIDVCFLHTQPSGCRDRASCSKLHICSKYILSKCFNDTCILGHNWDTNHNIRILRTHYLDHLSKKSLRMIIRSALSSVSNSYDQLDVCQDYNNGCCHERDCDNLHICQNYVMERLKCSRPQCTLNHNLLAPDCCKLMEAHGIDTNEAPLDVLICLEEHNPALVNRDMPAQNDKSLDHTTKANISTHIGKQLDSPSHTTNTLNDSKIKDTQKDVKPRTLWAHQLEGNCLVPEICYDSVEGKCLLETSGCKRMHAKQHFHWQVSTNSMDWFNLLPPQIACLEKAYCDPTQDDVIIPCIDESSLNSNLSNLLVILGKDSWEANFHSMTLVDATQIEILYIRRLCTQTDGNRVVRSSIFRWHYLDDTDNWVPYSVDESDTKFKKGDITSEHLEKNYLEDKYESLILSIDQQIHSMDFASMTLIQHESLSNRPVRRRPLYHIAEEDEAVALLQPTSILAVTSHSTSTDSSAGETSN